MCLSTCMFIVHRYSVFQVFPKSYVVQITFYHNFLRVPGNFLDSIFVALHLNYRYQTNLFTSKNHLVISSSPILIPFKHNKLIYRLHLHHQDRQCDDQYRSCFHTLISKSDQKHEVKFVPAVIDLVEANFQGNTLEQKSNECQVSDKLDSNGSIANVKNEGHVNYQTEKKIYKRKVRNNQLCEKYNGSTKTNSYICVNSDKIYKKYSGSKYDYSATEGTVSSESCSTLFDIAYQCASKKSSHKSTGVKFKKDIYKEVEKLFCYGNDNNVEHRKNSLDINAKEHSRSCGLSYNELINKVANILPLKTRKRLFHRICKYKNLKRLPCYQSKIAVVKDVYCMLPEQYRSEITQLFINCMDIIDPQMLLHSVIESDSNDIDEFVDDVDLNAVFEEYSKIFEVKDNPGIATNCLGHLRKYATRKPNPSKIADKRIADIEVIWDASSLSCIGNISKRLVFLSNLPTGPQQEIERAIKEAFLGVGKIVRMQICDERLRTIDETDSNNLMTKGGRAIEEKLKTRYSPVFAFVEFETEDEKVLACADVFRVFGIYCMGRLVYPEPAERKTTLVATNLPFQLTVEELTKILAYGLACSDFCDLKAPFCMKLQLEKEKIHSKCFLRMKNPKLYNYDDLEVCASSDLPMPYLAKPLHSVATDKNENESINNFSAGDDMLSYISDDYFEHKEQFNQAYNKVKFDQAIVARQNLMSDCVSNACRMVADHVDSCKNYSYPSKLENIASTSGDPDDDQFFPYIDSPENLHMKESFCYDSLSTLFSRMRDERDMAAVVLKKFLMDKQICNNDGMIVLRFRSFEEAYMAMVVYQTTIMLDTKAIVSFSPKKCVFHNGKYVDFLLPEKNYPT